MKLTSVELHPHGYSERVTLSFRDPTRQNPYNVKAIIGLDADEIVARYYTGSGGNHFYDLTLEKRDIIVRIALNPRWDQDESYSSLRDFLYKLVASSRTGLIHVHFLDGETMVAGISGFITKVEAPHFNKEAEVQITVSCDDPMLRAMSPVSVDVGSLDPADTNIQDDISTAPHGFKFEMLFDSAVDSFNIHDPSEPNWQFEVTPVGGFLQNDILHFSSEYNNRYIYVVRGGTPIHLADVITTGSVWPILFPGENPLSCDDAEAMTWQTITHYPTYWGV